MKTLIKWEHFLTHSMCKRKHNRLFSYYYSDHQTGEVITFSFYDSDYYSCRLNLVKHLAKDTKHTLTCS